MHNPASPAARGLPHSSHWGAFSVLARDGHIEIVPHPRDPDPPPWGPLPRAAPRRPYGDRPPPGGPRPAPPPRQLPRLDLAPGTDRRADDPTRLAGEWSWRRSPPRTG